MNTHIWCKDAESGQILWSETKSRNRVSEEVSTYVINLLTNVPYSDTTDFLGHHTHCILCKVAWKAVVRILIELRNSEVEPLGIFLNQPRAECPISPRTGAQA